MESLNNLTDASAIRQQLGRIQRAIIDDPALAVGSAKELIESTAKVVLTEHGLPVDDKADLPALVREAQQALGYILPPPHPARTAATRSRRSSAPSPASRSAWPSYAIAATAPATGQRVSRRVLVHVTRT